MVRLIPWFTELRARWYYWRWKRHNVRSIVRQTKLGVEFGNYLKTISHPTDRCSDLWWNVK